MAHSLHKGSRRKWVISQLLGKVKFSTHWTLTVEYDGVAEFLLKEQTEERMSASDHSGSDGEPHTTYIALSLALDFF